MRDLVNAIFTSRDEELANLMEIKLYDGATAQPEALLFQSAGADQDASKHTVTKKFELYGRTWLLGVGSTAQFDQLYARNDHVVVPVLGVLISFLLSAIVFAQSRKYHDTMALNFQLAAHQKTVHFLMREVNHHSKNLLGMVQAIARQTGMAPEQVSAFSSRLAALSASQDLLVKNQWAQISINALIRSQLEHLGGIVEERIQLNGDEIGVSPSSVQTLGMAVFELSTNAAKYGALSNDTGSIAIDWTIIDDPEGLLFEMSWSESEGPPAQPDIKAGFGSIVTGRMVEFDFGGRVTRTFDAAQFRWRLQCLLDNLQDNSAGDLV